MNTIHITRPHRLSLAAARNVAESVAADLDQEFGLQYRWEGELLRFETFGVRGDLHVSESVMTLQAHLGALFSPFRDRLESEIQRHFDKYLEAVAPSPQQAA